MNATHPDAASASARGALLPMVPLTLMVFACFLAMGLPLAALPLYVHGEQGFGLPVVGWVIGLQALATILTRSFSGRYCDRHSSRGSVLLGLPMGCASGLLYLASTAIPSMPWSLAALCLGRIFLGLTESLVLTGAMLWGMGRVGPQRTGLVMSWQGIAIFAGLGAGAPLGLLVMQAGGFAAVSLVTIVLPLIGLAIVWRVPAAAIARAGDSLQKVPFLRVIGYVWRQGSALSLGSIPFSVLTAFMVLYYASHGWSGAGLALSGFALGYVVVRVFFGKLPDQLGGSRVAAVSFAIEAAGQALLWAAPSGPWALAGATLTGLGFSLVFPSMGVEAVRRTPAAVRGLAISGFVAFLDGTTAVTGPLVGLLIDGFGYGAAFALGIVTCLMALAMSLFGMGKPHHG